MAKTRNTLYHLESVTGAHDQSRSLELIDICTKSTSRKLSHCCVFCYVVKNVNVRSDPRPSLVTVQYTELYPSEMVETITAGKRKSFHVKRKSMPRLLKLSYAHKRKQAKDEERLDGLYRKISARTMDVLYVRARTIEKKLPTQHTPHSIPNQNSNSFSKNLKRKGKETKRKIRR